MASYIFQLQTFTKFPRNIVWIYFQNEDDDDGEEDEGGVLEPLLNLQKTADEKQAESQIKLFSNTQYISLDKVETEVKKEEVKMKG